MKVQIITSKGEKFITYVTSDDMIIIDKTLSLNLSYNAKNYERFNLYLNNFLDDNVFVEEYHIFDKKVELHLEYQDDVGNRICSFKYETDHTFKIKDDYNYKVVIRENITPNISNYINELKDVYDLTMYGNKITTLKGLPNELNYSLGIVSTKIKNLYGIPSKIKGNLDIHKNELLEIEFKNDLAVIDSEYYRLYYSK